MITVDDLKRLCPFSSPQQLAKFAEPLNDAMAEYEINNVARETMFLAQIAHESGGFRYVRELASGEAYEGRADLGNTEAGDGVRFKGRGLIQITGRANYQAVGEALQHDFIAHPEELERPDYATRSAAWYWHSRGLNELADSGDFRRITKKINGGYNGMADRENYLTKAQEILG